MHIIIIINISKYYIIITKCTWLSF